MENEEACGMMFAKSNKTEDNEGARKYIFPLQ